MLAVNYSQLRENMKKYFDKVTQDYETLIVTRKENKNVVILSEEAYNNLLENMYITSSEANLKWISESMKEAKEGKYKERELIIPE